MIKRNFVFVVLLISSIVLSTTSCKKGEEDPFLSLKSRNSRLKGEWVLKSGEIVYTNPSGSNTTTYDGANKTVSGLVPYTEAYTESMTFEKDGIFSGITIEDGETITYEGTWAWLNKNKENETKNKEILTLCFTKYVEDGDTETYTGVEVDYTLQLQKLSSKEMIIKYNTTYTSGSYTSSEVGTKTYEKK